MIVLLCQRDQFEIPPYVAYLNAAFVTPLLKSVEEAGMRGVRVKSAPWRMSLGSFFEPAEQARETVARLVGATADDIAIVGSTSYGIATASLSLPLSVGARVIVMEREHPSQHYEWLRAAEAAGAAVETVVRPPDDDWTTAILARLNNPGKPEAAIAALAPVHWSDGAALDLVTIGQAARSHGTALVLDGTQAIGVVPFDVRQVRPDFLVFATYKLLLGPYGLAFLYAAPHRQRGRPLEQHVWSRIGADRIQTRYEGGRAFMKGARRYDMGERSNFITLPMAIAAIEQILEWGVDAIEERLKSLTLPVADAVPGSLGEPALLAIGSFIRMADHYCSERNGRWTCLRLFPPPLETGHGVADAPSYLPKAGRARLSSGSARN